MASPPEGARRARPFVPAETSLPEITVKAILLGVVLSVVLAGANAYLGLFAGLTVSASIPAAVISMAVLRLFRRSNILENNLVQTAASAGESLAAGVIFTLPALVMLGHWKEFDYLWITAIAGLGGVLGVLFTIPLRRALIVENPLTFPEGVATAEVLESGTQGRGIGTIASGAAIGALFKLGGAGLALWTETLEIARRVGGSIAYFGTNLSPALVSVGYIVGLNIAVLVFVGGASNWIVAIPIVAAGEEWPVHAALEGEAAEAWNAFPVAANAESVGKPVDAIDWAGRIWSRRTRYLGVGAMIVGGLWALLRLRRSLASGIRSGLSAYRGGPGGAGAGAIPRTERDTPMKAVLVALVASVVPIYLLYTQVVAGEAIPVFMAVVMLVAGFLFAAVAAYMAGLVGSSNNPISGVTIATILSAALALSALGLEAPEGPVAAIVIGAVVCCAAAIAGDNMQDLKAGYLLGATPWKQQVLQAVGTVTAAFVLAPILTLLLKAYGFGAPTAEHPEPLAAPQATLMKSVAEGVFGAGLQWDMIGIGAALAALVIVADVHQERRGSSFRLPVLAVAVGIYLPFELSVAILLGGLVAWAFGRRARGATSEHREEGVRGGVLFASGLITGEALLGILLAIPIVSTGERRPLALAEEGLGPWPGVALLVAVLVLLYRSARNALRRAGG